MMRLMLSLLVATLDGVALKVVMYSAEYFSTLLSPLVVEVS